MQSGPRPGSPPGRRRGRIAPSPVPSTDGPGPAARRHCRHLAALGATGPGEQAINSLKLERPRNPEHGDWSLNVFPLAKGAGRSGPELAAALADRLNAEPPAHLLKAEVIGGFVNLRLADTWLHDVLQAVVAGGHGRLRPARPRPRPARQRGVRVRQPDGSAARRPRPLGRLRRLGRPPAGPLRLRAAHRVLRQRPGRPARALRRCRWPPGHGPSSRPRTATTAPTSSEWAAEMPADADPAEWGRPRRSSSSARRWPRWGSCSTPGRASGS